MIIKEKEMKISQTCRADFAAHETKSALRGVMQRLVLTLLARFKRLALALCPTFLNPATPANSTEVSTTPLGRRRDLFLGDNLDLWLEPTRAAV
jgi:hypothetical protein